MGQQCDLPSQLRIIAGRLCLVQGIELDDGGPTGSRRKRQEPGPGEVQVSSRIDRAT